MFKAVAHGLADFVYPPVCVGCRDAAGTGAALCPRCWQDLRFVERPFCEVLGLPFDHDHGEGFVSPLAIAEAPPFARARAAVLHEGLGARLVASLKYGDRTDLAPAMAGWMRRAGADVLAEAETIVPVPLHRLRLFRRRFNQAAELSRRLAAETGIAHRPLALVRVRATRSQVGLGARARAENVRGAFLVPPGRRMEIADRRVLLVDDVYTTGSTAGSAARALLKAGARSVDVLTFSRVAENAAEPHMSA